MLANACTLGCPWPNNVCPKQPRFLLSRIQTLNNGATSPWSTPTTRCLLAARPTGYATTAHYRRSHEQWAEFHARSSLRLSSQSTPSPRPSLTLMPFSSSVHGGSRIVHSCHSSIGKFYRNFSRSEERGTIGEAYTSDHLYIFVQR